VVRRRVRIEVESSRIRHVAAGFIGNHGDIVADLILLRIAFEWIERVTHCDIRRPGNAGVRAIGVEQLGVGVIRSVSRVIPNSVQPSSRRDGECTEPVPLAGINRVVIDLLRRAEG